MTLDDAVRIIRASLTIEGRLLMPSEDFLRIPEAASILAIEYLSTLEEDE